MCITLHVFFYDYLTVSKLVNDFITSLLPEKTVAKTTPRQMRRRGRAEKIELVFRCSICHSTIGQLGFQI